LTPCSTPLPGSPELAAQIQQHLAHQGISAKLDARRGLDHGAWVPLMHLFAHADVPVVQVSLPFDADEAKAFALGQALAPLAQDGVLIVGSGSLTHKLCEFRTGQTEAASCAQEFSAWVRQAVRDGDITRLGQTLELAPHAARAHPTTEHFLPLLVAAGAALTPNPVTVLDGGIRHGVLAMESYVFGRQIEIKVEEPDPA
jgi:4,5-DOPA dioxygenase extradiol